MPLGGVGGCWNWTCEQQSGLARPAAWMDDNWGNGPVKLFCKMLVLFANGCKKIKIKNEWCRKCMKICRCFF